MQLLMCARYGTQDNNPGTLPLQSERLYSALKGLGKVHTNIFTRVHRHSTHKRVYIRVDSNKDLFAGLSAGDIAIGVTQLSGQRVSAPHAVGNGPVARGPPVKIQRDKAARGIALVGAGTLTDYKFLADAESG
jgi:hypothetical protein